jgi:DNA-binding CsgD family transcriptional regulator/tetratricopeptide (TPR) repeat protein
MKTWISDDDSFPFIGRSKQLEQLQQVLQAAQKGRVQTVFVQGEAGIGKTRLVNVVASEAALDNWLVLRGRSQTIGEGLAFAPVIEAFRMALLSLDGAQKLQLGEAFPYLNVFFSDLGGPIPVPLLNPALERTRLFETLRMFTVHLTAEQPLIIWLDDLPEADSDTLEWLQYCVQHTDRGRIVFVATCRTSHEPSTEAFLQLVKYFLRHNLLQTIQLEPLEASESIELMRTQLDGQVQDSILHSLNLRTLGVPLYILEVMHTLVQSKGLQLKNGNWELQDKTDDLVPLRITSLLEDRMEKLTHTEEALLTLLAASDRTISWKLLREASELESAALTESMLGLLHRSLIREEKKGRELEYEFRHPMIQAVAHARVPQTMLRQAHRKLAAAWIDHDVSRAAFHILESGNPDDDETSVRLLYEAGKRYLSLHSYRPAAEYLEQAALLVMHRAAPESADLQWNINLALSETLTYLDRPQQALRLLNNLYQDAAEAGTKIHLKRLMAGVESTRSYEQCLRHIVEGLERWDGQSGNDDVFWMLNERVFNDLNSGKLVDAQKSFQAMQVYVKAFPSSRASLLCLIREAHIALLSWKSPSAVLTQVDSMLEETRKLGEPELIYDLYCLMGYAALNQGDFKTALRYSAECTDLVRRNGMVVHEISVRMVGMCALFLRGDWEQSLQEAEAVELLAREYEIHGAVICTLDLKGLILVLRGNRDEGFALLKESENLVRVVFPEGGPSMDSRSLHVIDAVTELMQETLPEESFQEPIVVYWSNTHGMQLFLKLIEGLWLLKAGLEEPLTDLLDRLQTDAYGQHPSYVSGIMDLLSGLLARRHDDFQMAKERLTRAIGTFESLRTPFELAMARLAWARVLEPEHANAAMQKSADEFRHIGALACVDWVDRSPFSSNKGADGPIKQIPLLDSLTKREEEILRAVALGLSNKEIASTFGLTEGTVKIHVFNLYSKLGVKRRTQAIARAREWRLLE